MIESESLPHSVSVRLLWYSM